MPTAMAAGVASGISQRTTMGVRSGVGRASGSRRHGMGRGLALGPGSWGVGSQPRSLSQSRSPIDPCMFDHWTEATTDLTAALARLEGVSFDVFIWGTGPEEDRHRRAPGGSVRGRTLM